MKLLLFKHNTWIDVLIRWKTGSPYTHSAIVAGGAVYEATWPRVLKHTGAEAEFFLKDAARVIDLTTPKEEEVAAWADSHVGDEYDLIDLISFLFGFRIDRPSRWICSAFCAAALEQAGVADFEDVKAETPASLDARFPTH